jgi:hypothetical protein
MSIPYFLLILYAKFLIKLTSGYNSNRWLLNYLFKSFPAALVLEFPIMAPSGFSIGTIKKFTLSLNSWAYFVFEIKKSINPLIIWELFDSPGWILPVTKMFFFGSFLSDSEKKLVKCKRGISTPVKVIPKLYLRTNTLGKLFILYRS